MGRRVFQAIVLGALLGALLVASRPRTAIAQEPGASERSIYAVVVDSVLAAYARAHAVAGMGQPPITVDPEFGVAPVVDVRKPPRLGPPQPIAAGFDTLLRMHPADAAATDLASIIELRPPLCWTHAPSRAGTGESCPVGARGAELPPHLTMSRVAFSADSLRAVVYLTYWCGPLCGEGRYYLMSRAPGGAWRVAGTYLVSIS